MVQKSTIFDWFYQYGKERTGDQLIPFSWVLNASNNLSSFLRLSHSREKPSLALWGLSQSGKSTFLEHAFDPLDSNGNTALQWGNGSKVIFSVYGTEKIKNFERDGYIILNPYNGEQDGTSCISRYKLCDSVGNPEFPIRIKFLDIRSLLMTIAVGVEERCKRESIFWDNNSVLDCLNKHCNENDIPDEKNFLLLLDFIAVLGLLSKMDIPRYRNIDAGRLSLSMKRTFATSGLINAVSEILWDNFYSVSEYYRDAIEVLQKYSGVEVSCDYKALSLLIDTLSFEHATGRKECEALNITPWNADTALEHEITSLRMSIVSNNYCIGVEGNIQIFNNLKEFALFQSLISEFTIPVNNTILNEIVREHNELEKFRFLLNTCDILDFPGISRTVEGKILTDESLSTYPYLLYSRVLKIGKTCSVAILSAANFDVDLFGIIINLERGFEKVDVLIKSLDLWWETIMGKPVSELRNGENNLKIPIILTYLGTFFNQYCLNKNSDKLIAYFDKLNNLQHWGMLHNAIFMGANYNTEANNLDAVRENLIDAINRLRGNEKLQVRIGGVDSLYICDSKGNPIDSRPQVSEKLANIINIQRIGRNNLIVKANLFKKEILSDLRSKAPSGDNVQRKMRRDEIYNKAINVINKILDPDVKAKRDEVAPVGKLVSKFININPNIFPKVPSNLNLKENAVRVPDYVDRVVARIYEDMTSSYRNGIPELEIKSDEVKLFVESLVNTINKDEIVSFIYNELRTQSEYVDLRPYLAVKIGDILSGRGLYTDDTSPEEYVRASDEQIFYFRSNLSPYYVLVRCILEKLESILKTPVGKDNRPQQSGDAEILQIIGEIENINCGA